MADNLKTIREEAKRVTSEIVQSEMAIPFERLKQEAMRFLKAVSDIYEQGEKYRGHSNGNAELMRMWTIYRNKQTSQALALAQQNFAVALDSFLGREIILTYVNPKGELLMYTQEGEMQILEKVGKNAGRANFSSGAWKSAEQLEHLPAKFRTGTEGDLVRLINESAARRAEVYSTAYQRYKKVQKGEIHDKVRKRYYIRSSPTHLYFPEEGFSLGQMAEAYANAVVDDNKNITNSNMEPSLWYLWYRYIRGHKDNVAAILTGDVKIGTDGRLSLAIKGESASTAKIGQYIVAAYMISQMESATKADIQKWLETDTNLSRISDLAKKVEDEAREHGEEVLFEEIIRRMVAQG